jgi:8-oxo-dGTP diphosphatase
MQSPATYLHPKRNTGRALVIKDEQILLIERWRVDAHYFSIPGGGIEAGETPEITAIRELQEETSVVAKLEKLVYIMKDGTSEHFIYLANYQSGEPHLPADSEEAQAGLQNRFEPRWVPITLVSTLTFGYWQPLHAQLVHDLVHGFAGGVKITATSGE